MTESNGSSRFDSHVPKTFGKSAAFGVLFTGGTQVIRILITLASTILVSRLLLPGEFGVIAMVLPITGIALVFQDFGFNQAIIQSQNLEESHVNALFWINFAASAGLALLLVLLSPLVGLFYGDVRAAYVTAASGATVLAGGLGRQHAALMTRQLRFGALSIVDLVAVIITFVSTVVAAYFFRSYWAIWFGTFFGTLINSATLWFLHDWRPSRKISLTGTRRMVKFGANLTGYNLLTYFSRNTDNVLIAKVWGSVAVGLYDRSYKLMMFPIQNINAPLSRVIVPILSRTRSDPPRYRRIFLLTIRMISLVSIPAILSAAACSDGLVPFLLGPQWANASPIFFWLSLAAIIQPISNATGWLFITSGRAGAMMKYSLFATPVTIASFAAGLPWGPEGVAAAYFLTQSVRLPVLYAMCVKGTPIKTFDLYAVMVPSLAGGGIAWLAVAQFFRGTSLVEQLLAALLISYSLSLAFLAFTADGRDSISTVINVAKKAIERLKSKVGR